METIRVYENRECYDLVRESHIVGRELAYFTYNAANDQSTSKAWERITSVA